VHDVADRQPGPLAFGLDGFLGQRGGGAGLPPLLPSPQRVVVGVGAGLAQCVVVVVLVVEFAA
jgi:hypothetical protein